MKAYVPALAFLALCIPSLHAQKLRFGQQPPKASTGAVYPIRIHISGIHRRVNCDNATCDQMVYADAVLNGTRIELAGYWYWTRQTTSPPLGIGDYQTRMLKDTPNKSPMGREYELVFPDRTIWRGTVTGISE